MYLLEKGEREGKKEGKKERRMTHEAKISLKSAGGIGLAVVFPSLRFAASRNSAKFARIHR